MPMKSKMFFWAYKIKNGGVVVRRWFDNHDIETAKTTRLIESVMEKFVANGFPEADKIAENFFKDREVTQ